MSERESAEQTEQLSIEEPRFVQSINWSKAIWSISNPVFLHGKSNLSLRSGFYKIEYSGTTSTFIASGLGLFDQVSKKFERYLSYHIAYGEKASASSITFNGSFYIHIKSTKIFSITNYRGDFHPKDILTYYVLNIQKLEETPITPP